MHVCVCVCVCHMQNILIAIVGNAYTEALSREGVVEYTLIYIVWLRLVFFHQYLWHRYIKNRSTEEFVQFW